MRIKYDIEHVAYSSIGISHAEKQYSLVVRSMDTRARLPGFKSQLYRFLAKWSGHVFNLSVPQLPYP